MSTLGKKISYYRNVRGITQMEMAEQCNIDVRTIQRIEAGDVNPRMHTLRLIAKSLDLSFESLTDPKTTKNEISLKWKVLNPKYLIGWVGAISMASLVVPSSIILRSDAPSMAASIIAALQLIASLAFYMGFYSLGTRNKNTILIISSILMSGRALFLATHLSHLYNVELLGPYVKFVHPLLSGLWGLSFFTISTERTLARVSGGLQIMATTIYLFVFSANPWIHELLITLPVIIQGTILFKEARKSKVDSVVDISQRQALTSS